MKQMTCVQMGGPATCTAVISGNSADEMVANGTKHLTEAHPDMVEGMKTMSKEAGDQWRADFQKKWDAAPEM
jgi:hypothetical protein